METVSLSWSYTEFKTYVLLYAADTNQIITEEEKDFIDSQFDALLVKTMQKELDDDNDYERIQKIMAYIEQNHLTKKDLEGLLKEVEEIYKSDGKYDATEKAMYHLLGKLFNM